MIEGTENYNNYKVSFQHMSQREIRLNADINKGGFIGKSGGAKRTTGAGLTTGPHVHMNVYLRHGSNWVIVNPSKYYLLPPQN